MGKMSFSLLFNIYENRIVGFHRSKRKSRVGKTREISISGIRAKIVISITKL